MGVELTDIFITLKPRDEMEEVPARRPSSPNCSTRLLRDLPGQRLAYSQPIEMRINEMVSGVRADLGVKLFGDDFDVLARKAARSKPSCGRFRRLPTSTPSRSPASRCSQIKVDQDQIARYGLPAKTVLDLVESIGSKPLGDVVEGQLRFPLVARLPEEFRAQPRGDRLDAGAPPPSGRADSACRDWRTSTSCEGPSTITREWGQRRHHRHRANVRGRDLGSFVAEARQQIAEQSRAARRAATASNTAASSRICSGRTPGC